MLINNDAAEPSDYAELEAEHRRTIEHLDEVRTALANMNDELTDVRVQVVKQGRALSHAVATVAALNGDYADALVYVADLLDNMMGSEDMEEVQQWKERFESEIALARRVKAAVQK